MQEVLEAVGGRGSVENLARVSWHQHVGKGEKKIKRVCFQGILTQKIKSKREAVDRHWNTHACPRPPNPRNVRK